MIVCAAVRLHIDKTNEDVILCGPRHHYIYKQLEGLGFEPNKGYSRVMDGFVTNTGRFLNRTDSLVYAVQVGQVNANIRDEFSKGTKIELYSEDLW